MNPSTAADPATGRASANGTHPEGIDPDDAQTRAEATVLGMEEGQLTFAVGGKKPDTSKLGLRGRAITLPGQFQKGDEVTVQMRIRIGEVHFIDKIDSTTEEVTGCTRKQVARIVGDLQIVQPNN
jgi:hypothetical protein